MWNLKQLSEEELKEFQERYPLAPKPKGPWELWDGNIRLGFYTTEEEANGVKKQYADFDHIIADFDIWVEKEGEDFDVETSQIETWVREHLHEDQLSGLMPSVPGGNRQGQTYGARLLPGIRSRRAGDSRGLLPEQQDQGRPGP